MPDYRRAWCPGGTWFFTINLQQRHGNDLLVRNIDSLRMAVRYARNKHPFNIRRGMDSAQRDAEKPPIGPPGP